MLVDRTMEDDVTHLLYPGLEVRVLIREADSDSGTAVILFTCPWSSLVERLWRKAPAPFDEITVVKIDTTKVGIRGNIIL